VPDVGPKLTMTPSLLDALHRLALVAADLRQESASLRAARERLLVQSADYRARVAEREWQRAASMRAVRGEAKARSTALRDAPGSDVAAAHWTPAGQQ
jgi:hypothetical protein